MAIIKDKIKNFLHRLTGSTAIGYRLDALEKKLLPMSDIQSVLTNVHEDVKSLSDIQGVLTNVHEDVKSLSDIQSVLANVCGDVKSLEDKISQLLIAPPHEGYICKSC